MTDDRDAQLRARLARLDPAPAALDPVESPRARELLERVMSAPSTTTPAPDQQGSTGWSRKLVGAAAAVAVLGGAGALALAVGGDSGSPAKESTRTTLSLQAGDVMSSCLPFDVATLKGMSPAFAGTVTSVDGDTVVLDVTKVYAGSVGDEVVLSQPGGATSAALDGVAFAEGKAYLVTAAQGVVNGCGYSGLATPDLTASFEQAFSG